MSGIGRLSGLIGPALVTRRAGELDVTLLRVVPLGGGVMADGDPMEPTIGQTAVRAAQAATLAAGELLRFAQDGDCCPPDAMFRFSLEPETLGQLAGALRDAMAVEHGAAEARGDGDGLAAMTQLGGAIERFLEVWPA